MKSFFILLLVFMAGFFSHRLLYGERSKVKRPQIIKMVTAPEGTSIVLAKGIDTFAYDYLSVDELNAVLQK